MHTTVLSPCTVLGYTSKGDPLEGFLIWQQLQIHLGILTKFLQTTLRREGFNWSPTVYVPLQSLCGGLQRMLIHRCSKGSSTGMNA